MTSCIGDYCGTGSGNFPQPGDPDMNNSILQVVPAFGGIDVSWTYPELLPEAVAHTILYRSTSGTEASAVRYRTVQGDYFFDRLDSGIEHFYWIQFVSVNGTVGPMIGPESAVARPTIDAMIEMLSGKIHDGLLAESLRTQIGRIDLIDQAVLDESAERLQSMDNIGGAFNLLQTDVDDVRMKLGEEVVRRATDNDALVSVINALQAKTNNNLAMIHQEQTVRANADGALSELITTLQATSSGNTAAIASEAQTRADEDEALSTKIDTLTAAAAQVFRQPTAPKSFEDGLSIGDIWIDSGNANQVYEWNGLNWIEATAGVQAPWSTIKKEQVARASENLALSQDITSLFTSVDDNQTLIETEQLARADADDTLATSITTLRTEVADDLEAAIQTEQLARADSEAALATQIDTVMASIARDRVVWVSDFDSLSGDFDRWSGPTIVGDPDRFSSDQSALVTSSDTTPSSGGVTGAVRAEIEEQTAMGFAGNRVKVTVFAKQPPTNAAAEFGVAYSTNAVGNSGWFKFTPTVSWDRYSFLFDVPIGNPGTDWIGIWGDTSGAGKGVLIGKVIIERVAVEADIPEFTAAIQSEALARADQDDVLALQISTVQTAVDDNYTAIETETLARIYEDGLLASQITSAQTSFEDDLATVETTLQTSIGTVNGKVTEIGALYTAKVDVNGLIGGFGVYNDGTTIQAGFDADLFWVGKGNTKRKPFIVDTVSGETYIDNAVIQNAAINSARIQDGAIINAKIIDGAITTAKIVNGAITNAKIGSAAISTANIADAAITNAKIGSAAITNTKIANAAITNAKIGTAAVDTLNIAGQAVTIPTGISYTNRVSISAGDEYTAMSIVVNPKGGKVLISGSILVTGENVMGTPETTIHIKRSGTTLSTIYIAGTYNHVPLAFVDSASLGDTNYTYSITVRTGATGSAQVEARSLTVIGLKR